ncbi:transposase [Candidatus Sulfurimonas marisnigri]|uniref:Transposase n=1 Tax=Candidatus Sulfurimonas marisnigri TaxID=2740405 RepID=A0A7S7LYT3_9BACT|nr:transposase [Candidatus Sulfurimonas marisnigri]QOY53978.1 transposase [Candidatus Sulfurimonas marisnigri]
MKCIYCNNEKLYKLKSAQVKCSKCKKKFSPKRVEKDLSVIECFCENLSIDQTSKKLLINYVSVKNRYELFRQLIAKHLEEIYRDKAVIEYDEYIYLPKSKKKIKENIFDAQNFLTFHYENKVYNLLMTNLNIHKKQFLDDGVGDAYFKEFSKFMMYNKISKTQKRENVITKFWLFFEESILKYKGIKDENFFYYLKEIEFKFNYKLEEQREILINLY